MVGGGAAGILAAWRAATLGADVTLLEKTERIGTKILISGGGKCNITHDGPMEEVLRAFRKNEAAFLRPSFYRFTNKDILKLLTDRGFEVYTRDNGRVFPLNSTAKDIVAILRRVIEEAGVHVVTECRVTGLLIEEGYVRGVQCHDLVRKAEQVVVCAGGSSYPNTGTTGDGWPWLASAGHRIVKVRAALAPIQMLIDETWPERAGVSLRDCLFKAKQAGKELGKWREDLLFTHQGVSGPCALGISREIAEASGSGPVDLFVDLVPDESFELVSSRVQDWLIANPRRPVSALADGFLPASLAKHLLVSANVDGAILGARLDRKSRNRLIEAIKGWNIGRVRDVPIEKGEVVAGGVALDEVDPKTMESKLVKGLYLCGEILDIAGPVGGYNLQAAWSTGYVAGESAAQSA